jgi:hypothetical protein
METTKLTVRVPREDLEFVKRYPRDHGMMVTALIDRYFARLRQMPEGGGSPRGREDHGTRARYRRRAHPIPGTPGVEAPVRVLVDRYLPSHAIPTLHCIVERSAGREKAGKLVDWLLRQLEVVEEGRAEFLQARTLGFDDFGDAVVAAGARPGEV